MQKSGSEILVYILLIGGFLLFNYITQQLARKAREQQEAAARAEAARQAAAQPQEEDVLEDLWGRSHGDAPQSPLPELAPAPARRGTSLTADAMVRPPVAAHRLFRSREDLRDAIVLMTVLGPCRALEPPEDRH